MRMLLLIFCVIICHTIDVRAQEKDTVYFYHQNPLIGELKGIRYGTMLFRGEDLGNLEIDLNQVRTIRAYGYGYRIKTAHREFIMGVFKPHDEDGKVTVYDGYEDRTFTVRNLNDVQLIHKNFFRRIAGRVGAGYSYTRSSDIGRWNGDLVLGYDTERLDVDLRGSIIITQAEEVLDRERESLLLTGNYYFNPNWFAFGMGVYQRNIQLGINRRIQQGLGVGLPMVQHKRGILTLQLGIVTNQEINIEDVRTTNLYEVPVILDFTFFKLNKPKINFTSNQTLFIGLTQGGRYRNDGETRINWEIVNNIDLGVNFYNNFDNQPPIPMGSNFDYGLVFNLGYRF